jgi:8-hydroxy-5-deazaflavin:NADPH oxidoreductase
VNIAIIGTGNVGSGLAAGFVRAGHRVYLAGRSADHVEEVALATGAEASANPVAAAALADVIVLAVPFTAVEKVADAIRPVVNGTTIVDVSNPSKPDRSGPLFAGAGSAAEQIAAWLPDANVVKAFNTVFAGNLVGPGPDGIPLDGYVAGEDAEAKARVLDLAASIGLQPIDVGGLKAARLLESMAWLNISLNQQPGWSWRTGWKLVGAPESKAA